MPIGYRAILLGSGTTLEDLRVLRPQEDSTPEGSLILLELNFAGEVSAESLSYINEHCSGMGVPPWPGNTQVAYTSGQTLSLMWVKGFAWLPLILGVLALTVLPLLLGGLIWWLIPEEVKKMINAFVMILMMMLMMKFMKPMLSAGAKEETKS